MEAVKPRITSKEERNRQLYRDYCDMIACEPNAHVMSKSHFYDKLSEKYFIEAKTVSKIINSQLRHAN